MNAPDRVTIGITCFNARDTILRAIDSALAQDWPEIEVIVVDDASTDGSADLIEERLAAVPNAHLFRLERNGGVAAARNVIVEHATGAFICVFDDDDESLPNRVPVQHATLIAAEAAHETQRVACYASTERRYANGYTKLAQAIGSQPEAPHGSGLADYLLFHRRIPGWFYGAGVPTCSLMARTGIFRELGGFDPRLRRLQDVDFAIRLALTDGWFVGTSEPLLVQNITYGPDKAREIARDCAILIATKNEAYLRSVNRFDYARKWPLLRYQHFKRQYGRLALTFLSIFVRHPIAATRHILTTGPRRLLVERRVGGRNKY